MVATRSQKQNVEKEVFLSEGVRLDHIYDGYRMCIFKQPYTEGLTNAWEHKDKAFRFSIAIVKPDEHEQVPYTTKPEKTELWYQYVNEDENIEVFMDDKLFCTVKNISVVFQ